MNAKLQRASNAGRVREIFCELRRIEHADERERILAERTGDDKELRREVEQLLSAAQLGASSPLERVGNIIGPTEFLDVSSNPDGGTAKIKLHSMIGPYKLMEQIGEGGMGLVYVALQQKPIRRTVALKVIKPGMSSKQVLARFEAERQALAMMNHPNIAKVLDAGTTESGTPYFAMELVRGIPITEYCEKHKRDLRERLELFVRVCDAVQHAHHKGIIHRDLKPSNILVELEDVRPVPKVIDFGVAKAMQQPLTEQTIYTGIAQMIGTPLYMSPEQAELNGLDVDTRSDVYSLGVVLYELITGSTPFDRDTLKHANFDEMRRIIREEEPIRPSSRISTLLNRRRSTLMDRDKDTEKRVVASIQSELDWIVMRALEKDRARRYPTASAVGEDISRFLKGEAVEACPPSLGYRMSKLARKHRAALAIASLIFFGLLTTAVGTGWQAMRATTAEKSLAEQLKALQEEEKRTLHALQIVKDSEAHQKRLRAEADAAAARERDAAATQKILTAQANWSRYQADMRFAHAKISQNAFSDSVGILSNHIEINSSAKAQAWELNFLLGQTNRDTQGWKIGTDDLRDVAWSPNGREIATVGGDGTCRVISSKTGDVIKSWHLGQMDLCSVAWSPDGEFLAWGSTADENMVRIWERATDRVQEIQLLPANVLGSVWTIGWSKDSNSLVAGCLQPRNSPSEFPDVELQQNIFLLVRNSKNEWVRSKSNASEDHPRCTRFSPDGSQVAVVSVFRSVLFLDATNLAFLSETSFTDCQSGDWLAGSSIFICGTENGDCIFFDTASGQEIHRFHAHFGAIHSIATSPDGTRVATGGLDGWVRIWDAAKYEPLSSAQRHYGPVVSLAWSSDSKQIVSAGKDGFAFVHTTSLASDRSEWAWDRKATDNRWTASEFRWTKNNCLRIVRGSNEIGEMNPRTGELLRTISIKSSDWTRLISSELAALTFDSEGYVASIEDSGIRYRIEKPWRLVTNFGDSLIGFMGDEQTLICIDPRGVPEELQSQSRFKHVCQMRFSNSGRQLAIVGAGLVSDPESEMWAGWLHVLNVDGETSSRRVRLGDLNDPSQMLESVAWSPDDQWIVTTNRRGLCRISDAAQLRTKWTRLLHRGVVHAIAWHPDGTRVATAGMDGKINVWEPQTGDIVLSLDVNDRVFQLEFSPDGTMLAASLGNGPIAVWDALPGQQLADSKLMIDLIKTHTMDGIVRQENWSKLRDVIQRGIERSDASSVSEWFDSAQLHAWLGDTAGYTTACRSLMEVLVSEPSPVSVVNACWACVLLPSALVDYSIPINATKIAIERNGDERLDDYLLVNLGALYLRNGDAPKALETLKPVVERNSENGEVKASTIFLLALTYHALKATEQSQKYCEEANQRMEIELSDSNISWNRRLSYQIFHREANQAIFGD